MTEPTLFPDPRAIRRRDLEAQLAALDAEEALTARRRDLARLVVDAPDAATARTHLLALAAAIDAEEAGTPPPEANGVAAIAATLPVCPKCQGVRLHPGGPCPHCAPEPLPEKPKRQRKAKAAEPVLVSPWQALWDELLDELEVQKRLKLATPPHVGPALQRMAAAALSAVDRVAFDEVAWDVREMFARLDKEVAKGTAGVPFATLFGAEETPTAAKEGGL